MDYLPSEDSVVINPITGSTMLGANISREISPNKPQPDEIAYMNRIRLHVKNHPSLKGSLTIADKASYVGLKGYNNHSKYLNSSIRGKEFRKNNALSNSIDASSRINVTQRKILRNKSVDFTSGQRKMNMHTSKLTGIKNLNLPVNSSKDKRLQHLLQLREKVDEAKMRSLKNSDIEGACPNHFRHRPRKYFVDRKEIKKIFNQTPGKYHGFLKDINSGGTYIADKPDPIFKWSLNNSKDLNNRFNMKKTKWANQKKYTNSLSEIAKNASKNNLNKSHDYTSSTNDYQNYTPIKNSLKIREMSKNSSYGEIHYPTKLL
ncbi:unnamed protein product [Moneuplotes crassus]|uniref:Uncharacterized protein n=2 Tax=Euplotes crassus TaxID=5936 RepID=A0AAD1XEK0_EUPCR|nr:unnamed protein product [Moneuplotes crassus]